MGWSLGFSPFFLLLFSNHTKSPLLNNRGSVLSVVRISCCWSRNNSCTVFSRSCSSLTYCDWVVSEVTGRSYISWSGNLNSLPSIMKLAVSPVVVFGVPLKVLMRWGRRLSHSSCPPVISSARRESPRTRLFRSTCPLDWGWYGVVLVFSTPHSVHNSAINCDSN